MTDPLYLLSTETATINNLLYMCMYMEVLKKKGGFCTVHLLQLAFSVTVFLSTFHVST